MTSTQHDPAEGLTLARLRELKAVMVENHSAWYPVDPAAWVYWGCDDKTLKLLKRFNRPHFSYQGVPAAELLE